MGNILFRSKICVREAKEHFLASKTQNLLPQLGLKDGASQYRCNFEKVMTMGEK